jgi:membrane-bound lytic murein transglycosylase C
VTRIAVTARVAMLPDHLRRRALQYQELVPAYAKQHGLDPRLLFAMIHTESFFNPKAQSPSPTYGLMQLVPRGAARDAYNFLYKEDRVLDDDYLLDPAHNVELGAAYLRLLGKQLFAGMEDGDKRTALLLCAYKWGPGNTQSKILKQVRVQDLTNTQVQTLLTQRTPEDTRLYLKQVRDRMALYEDVLSAPPSTGPVPLTTAPAAP